MNNLNDDFLSGIGVLQLATKSSSSVARKAVDLAGQMARQLGADVFVDDHFETDATFASRGKIRLSHDIETWLESDPLHFVLAADSELSQQLPNSRVVLLQANELSDCIMR